MGTLSILVSQFLILILCMVGKPIGQDELRIDVLDEAGYIKTILINPYEGGYKVYDLKNESLYEVGVIYRFEKEDYVYICKNIKEDKVLIDLEAIVKGFDTKLIRDLATYEIQLSDNRHIKFQRSNSLLYISSIEDGKHYVVH